MSLIGNKRRPLVATATRGLFLLNEDMYRVPYGAVPPSSRLRLVGGPRLSLLNDLNDSLLDGRLEQWRRRYFTKDHNPLASTRNRQIQLIHCLLGVKQGQRPRL